MRNFRIFTKLFLTHSAVGLFALITLSVIFYNLLRDALIERTLDQLSSINILKKELVENYLFTSQQNLEALQVENYCVVAWREFFSQFSSKWDTLSACQITPAGLFSRGKILSCGVELNQYESQ